MPTTTPALLDSFSALADPTRCRILLVLERNEQTVSELCAVLQLPQSTVSRHLKTLADAEWVASRRDGTSRYYTFAPDKGDGTRAAIWALTHKQWAGRPGIDQDARRLAHVLARRTEASQRFFASSAGRWDRLREDLFGQQFPFRALLSFIPSGWTVADLGCGTGSLVEILAPHVRRVIGVDASDGMLAPARARVAHLTNVDLRQGSLEKLPIDAASVDAATMMLVLHHVPSPADAIAEAARVLRPGGRLLIVDMTPHDREEYRQQMGHIWLGFSPDQMRRLLRQGGFSAIHLHTLPPAADAMGPELFVATGTLSESSH